MSTLEGLYTEIFKKFGRKPLAKSPVPRMTYAEATRRYGIDRPDIRFSMELIDLTGVFKGTAFNAFRSAIDAGGAVRGLVVPGKADATRKEIDAWQAHAKTKGAKGLASFGFAGFETRSPVAKFLTPEELTAVRTSSKAKDGELLLVVADTFDVATVHAIQANRVTRQWSRRGSSPLMAVNRRKYLAGTVGILIVLGVHDPVGSEL